MSWDLTAVTAVRRARRTSETSDVESVMMAIQPALDVHAHAGTGRRDRGFFQCS